MRKCILVVGMHRSGTSLMAGALRIMGVDFGKKFLGYDEGNVKGHFEHIDILDANNAVLSVFGSSWKDTRELPVGWENDPRIAVHVDAIRQVIARDFGGAGLFGVKEPRVSILLPLYLKLLREASVAPLFIVMERPDAEIAESLYARDKIPSDQSLELCRKYKHAIDTHTSGEDAVVRISFDDLIRDPRSTLTRIGSELEIRLRRFEEAEAALRDFIDPGLKHFKAGKLTPVTLRNRFTQVVDAVLPFHTRRRRFVKNVVEKFNPPKGQGS